MKLNPEIWVVAESLEEAQATLKDRRQVAAIVSTTWTDWFEILSKKINCITKKYKCKPTLISATYDYQQERKMAVYGPRTREIIMSSPDPLLPRMAENVKLALIGFVMKNSLEYYKEAANAHVLTDCVYGESIYGGTYPCYSLLNTVAANTEKTITTIREEGVDYYYATRKLMDIPDDAFIAPIALQSVDRIDRIERLDENTIEIVIDVKPGSEGKHWRMPSKKITTDAVALQNGFTRNGTGPFIRNYAQAMIARIQF